LEDCDYSELYVMEFGIGGKGNERYLKAGSPMRWVEP
jgi:hypothetical protein